MNANNLLHQRYEIKDVLGQGGFATTYLAIDTETQQKCAIKCLLTLIYLLSHKDPAQMEKHGLRLDFRPHANNSRRKIRGENHGPDQDCDPHR